MEKPMLLLQIFMLALGFSSNRADAMVGAAAFAVLCVVIVLIGEMKRTNYARGNK